MAKDDIKKAKAENAERIANIAYSGGGHIGQDDLETAFENGAEWRINSVWHPTTDIPNRKIDKNYCGEAVLIQTLNGGMNFGIVCYRYGYNGEMCYTVACLDMTYTMDQIKQWAYVEDLKPNMEE